MIRTTALATARRWLGRLVVLVAFVAGVTLLILWLAGTFTAKVPEAPPVPLSQVSRVPGDVAPVRLVRRPRHESAVGTVRAVHETTIGSKLLARVIEVNVKAGQKIRAGDVLVRLDDSDHKARHRQAIAAVASSEAVRAQAESNEKRFAQLRESRAVSLQDYEEAATALRSAEANLSRARETANEVQAILDWATVRSPIDGTIIDKKVEVGDMVTPGHVLVTLFDPKRMQLVASVRESLAHRLKEGQSIGVEIERLGKQCSGTVSEIVPEAQSASRTFQVKVTGPCPPGIYSGMFGRLLIPLEQEEILLIPAQAVRSVGQLQLVDVVVGHVSNVPLEAESGTIQSQPASGVIVRRSIRTGRQLGDDVEVLSGLREGEHVVVPTSPKT